MVRRNEQRLLGTDFSWPESRVLFEIYIYCGINATELCEAIALIEKNLRENDKKMYKKR